MLSSLRTVLKEVKHDFKHSALTYLLIKFLNVCDHVFEYSTGFNTLDSIFYEKSKLVVEIQLHCIKIEKTTRFADFFPKFFSNFSRVHFPLC